jgi:molybdopterin converting factor subunit 1
MIEVEVLFFARARELAGHAGAKLALPSGATVAGAAAKIAESFPALGAMLKSCRFAVNEELARDDETVPDHAVLAVIPPVSGG